MYIAQQLKKENICEYLLYMWQLEDLIRACGLNMDEINRRIVESYPLDISKRKILLEWYESLVDMMRLENVQQIGHLQLNKNVMLELEELHTLLLKSGIDASYSAKFYHVLPFVSQLRNSHKSVDCSDIEICFNFQYGIMLLRMKKVEISQDTLQAQTEISKFMVLLSRNYNQYKAGKLEFED
jgi:hypothetical protein